jgi:hypothetical protein
VVFLAHEKGDMGRGMGIIERIGEVFEVRIEVWMDFHPNPLALLDILLVQLKF